jgi:site-specific recombinase XerD
MPERSEELPLFSQQQSVASASRSATAGLRGSSSLSAAVSAWSEALRVDGRSIHTIKAFTSDITLLGKFLGAGQAVNTISTQDLRRFLDWMQKGRRVPCSPKTYARRVTSLKVFFRWLVEKLVLSEDPAAAVPQHTVLSPLPEILTPEEVRLVLDTADEFRHKHEPDARPYTLLALLLQTGIKKSECLTIDLNHIDVHTPGGPTLFVRYGDVRKRYRERKLALAPDWVPAYREYLAKYAPRQRLFPYSPRRLEYLLEEIGTAAGLDKHVSFNMCRWTSALQDYQAGIEADRIRQKLGLSKIQWREVGTKLDQLATELDPGKEAGSPTTKKPRRP